MTLLGGEHPAAATRLTPGCFQGRWWALARTGGDLELRRGGGRGVRSRSFVVLRWEEGVAVLRRWERRGDRAGEGDVILGLAEVFEMALVVL